MRADTFAQRFFRDSGGLSSAIQTYRVAKRTKSPPAEIRFVARTRDDEW
jgi:hypothetical protein